MSTTFLYGLILAIGQIVLSLVGFFLGYQTDKINSGAWFGIMPLLLSIAVLVFGLRAVREEDAGKYLPFGKGVGTGLMICLYSGLIGAVYTYIHFTFVNPNFADFLIEASRTKWAAAGMSDTQMEGAEKGMRMFTKPAIQAVFGLVISVVLGLILSLIIAAVVKRNPPEEGKVVA
jgi:F0F1-type ATP synthase assembly protein I